MTYYTLKLSNIHFLFVFGSLLTTYSLYPFCGSHNSNRRGGEKRGPSNLFGTTLFQPPPPPPLPLQEYRQVTLSPPVPPHPPSENRKHLNINKFHLPNPLFISFTCRSFHSPIILNWKHFSVTLNHFPLLFI